MQIVSGPLQKVQTGYLPDFLSVWQRVYRLIPYLHG